MSSSNSSIDQTLRRIREASRPQVPASLPIDHALQQLITTYLSTLYEALTFFLDTRHPAGIHRFRVTIRRIRVLLKLFHSVLPGELRRYRKWLKEVYRQAGQVRDLDIVLEELERREAKKPGRLQALLSRAQQEREAAVVAFETYLRGSHFGELSQQFKQHLLSFRLYPEKPGSPFRVSHLLPAALWERYGAIRAFDTLTAQTPPFLIHRFRNRCKQLRYAIDPFRDALGRASEVLIARLATVQDASGRIQDIQVIIAWLNEQEMPEAMHLAEELEAECIQQCKHAPAWWEMITDPAFRRALGEGTAEI